MVLQFAEILTLLLLLLLLVVVVVVVVVLPPPGAGAPHIEAGPLARDSNPPVATTPVSAPEQGTGTRSGVGLWASCCSSPLLLACVVKVNYQ